MFRWSQGGSEGGGRRRRGCKPSRGMSVTLVYNKSYIKNSVLIEQGSVFNLPNKTFVFLS